MGYLHETKAQALKSTIPRTINETENVKGNGDARSAVSQLEIRQPPSLNADYLKKNIASSDAADYVARRRMFEVNGAPMDHWKKENFQTKRDDTCRIVYEPKLGKEFFQKTLRDEDYTITRSLTTSLEQPYFSKYNRFFPSQGHFCCKGCGNPLYSAKAKFDVDDGWPAFGACILGSIGVTSVEERVAQIEKQDEACIKIQAIVRGYQCRHRVETMLDELINELLQRKYARMQEEGQDDWSATEGHTSSDLSSDMSFTSWSSNSDDTDTSGKTKGSNGGYVLSRALGDDYAEIHCHRCKSHLGDLFAQKNIGSNGTKYRERHRVNGRALKYVEEDLPRRINADASLLFADASQRQRFGLPNTENGGSSFKSFKPLERSHLKEKPPVNLGISKPEHATNFEKHRKMFDNLSKNSQPPSWCKRKIPKATTKAIKIEVPKKKTDGNKRRRPMRRGSTETSLNISKRVEFLEKAFLTRRSYYANE